MNLPGDYFGFKKGIKDQKLLMAYLSQKITEHECTLDPDNLRDYIDAFLIQKRQENSTSRFFTGYLTLLWLKEIFSYSCNLIYSCTVNIKIYLQNIYVNFINKIIIVVFYTEFQLKMVTLEFFLAGTQFLNTSIVFNIHELNNHLLDRVFMVMCYIVA